MAPHGDGLVEVEAVTRFRTRALPFPSVALSVFIGVHRWFLLPGIAVAQEAEPTSIEDSPVEQDAVPADEPGASVLDEQSGYYWTFAFVATAAEVLGGVALGAGVAQVVDGYDRDDLAGRTATVEDGDTIRSTAETLETTGWIMSSVGVLGFGLGFALDFVLGDEFGDEDWWVRVGITTPLAAAAAGMISAGVIQVYRAGDYRAMALKMGTAAERDARQAEADDFAILGWSLIGAGGAAALAVTALFSFMNAWNEFILAATLLNDASLFTLPVALQRLVGEYQVEWGQFAAGALIVSAPVMALFFALQKHLVGGLTSGGVKG